MKRIRRTIARRLLLIAFAVWSDFEPRVTRLSFAFEMGRGMVVYYRDWQSHGRMSLDDGDNLGCRLVYIPDSYADSVQSPDEYFRSHQPLHPEARRYEVGKC